MKLDKEDIDFLFKKGYDEFDIEDMDYLRHDNGRLVYGYDDLGKWYTDDCYERDGYDSTFLVDSFNKLPFEFFTNKEDLKNELNEKNIVFEAIYEDENLSRYIDIIEKYIDWDKYGREVIGYMPMTIIPIKNGKYFVYKYDF